MRALHYSNIVQTKQMLNK